MFTVTGRALECRGTTGEVPADGIRYAIDSLPTGTTPQSVDANGAFSISLSETDVAAIATGGRHYLIVQALKGTTWGAVSSVQLIVDNAAPALDIHACPAIVNASGDLVITGSATDRYLGESDVTSVAWQLVGRRHFRHGDHRRSGRDGARRHHDPGRQPQRGAAHGLRDGDRQPREHVCADHRRAHRRLVGAHAGRRRRRAAAAGRCRAPVRRTS